MASWAQISARTTSCRLPFFPITFQKPATQVKKPSVATVQKKAQESSSSDSDSDDESDEDNTAKTVQPAKAAAAKKKEESSDSSDADSESDSDEPAKSTIPAKRPLTTDKKNGQSKDDSVIVPMRVLMKVMKSLLKRSLRILHLLVLPSQPLRLARKQAAVMKKTTTMTVLRKALMMISTNKLNQRRWPGGSQMPCFFPY